MFHSEFIKFDLKIVNYQVYIERITQENKQFTNIQIKVLFIQIFHIKITLSFLGIPYLNDIGLVFLIFPATVGDMLNYRPWPGV